MKINLVYEELLSISIDDLRRAGCLDNTAKVGSITWRVGQKIADVYFGCNTDPATLKFCLSYFDRSGEDVTQIVELRPFVTPISKETRYNFVCPETGRQVGRLYFVEGRFRTRHTFHGRHSTRIISRKRFTHPAPVIMFETEGVGV